MSELKLHRHFMKRLQQHRLVAAVKSPKQLERVVQEKERVSAVLLMTGNVLTLEQYVRFIQSHGLPVIVHVEKIGGLHMDRDGIEFMKRYVKPFGIVTTRTGTIKKAKAAGLFVIQRVFLIDTEVYEHLMDDLPTLQADAVEIMPCRAPDFVKRIASEANKPILTGGLLHTVTQAYEALNAGATAVTTSNVEMWTHDFSLPHPLERENPSIVI